MQWRDGRLILIPRILKVLYPLSLSLSITHWQPSERKILTQFPFGHGPQRWDKPDNARSWTPALSIKNRREKLYSNFALTVFPVWSFVKMGTLLLQIFTYHRYNTVGTHLAKVQKSRFLYSNELQQWIPYSCSWAPWSRMWMNVSIYFQARSQNFEKRLLALSCLSVCLSLRPYGTTRLPLDGFSWNLKCLFRKSVEKTQVSIQSDKKK